MKQSADKGEPGDSPRRGVAELTPFRRTLATSPQDFVAHREIGLNILVQGSADEGFPFLARAAQLAPQQGDSRHNLAMAQWARGERRSAAREFRRALTVDPALTPSISRLSALEEQVDRRLDALRWGLRADALDPGRADAVRRLLRLAYETDRKADALRIALRALPAVGEDAGLTQDVASALAFAGQAGTAAALIEPLLKRFPDRDDGWTTLANAYLDLGRRSEAKAAYFRAIALSPAAAHAHRNLGNFYCQGESAPAAIACYMRGLAIAPDDADTKFCLANAALLDGRFDIGWRAYEARWRIKSFNGPYRRFAQPRWRGERRLNETILVHWEQGFGDTIQFARFLPAVIARVGQVAFECQEPLERLMAASFPTVCVTAAGRPLPSFDAEVPLLDLPRIFQTRIDTIPNRIPYLAVDPVLVARWKRRLSSDGRLKIGIVWQGDPEQRSEPWRSVPLMDLVPVLRVAGCEFFLLQKQFGREAIGRLPHDLDVQDLGSELADFETTAAILECMDLVISSCTSVAHLAGSLGRPLWVLLRVMPDWRWLLARDDSPWYPHARLFRQTTRGDWSKPIAALERALRAEVEKGRLGRSVSGTMAHQPLR
jgi:tetratricopeptide (TPR) repeat protein